MNKTRLKDIPSVNKVLLEVRKVISINDNYIKNLIIKEIRKVREEIKKGAHLKTRNDLLKSIKVKVITQSAPSLINIINGTGVVLHTGLGRAPFKARSLKNIADKMDGYVNLEFDLMTGKRGDRQEHIREHLSSVCNSESSLVVNNNAAAVMLAINEMAQKGEVIVSRGQLVEIGGSFRIPDIVKKSGAILKEVGTTNRTNIKDYENAITEKTKLILWVHTSNYIIKGFTHSVQLNELVSIGRRYKIPVMVDWGSGSLLDMSHLNFSDEIPIRKIMKNKPDILTFSGDKLIGGPQSGIIVGKIKWINALQKNILYRVLRSDKITIGLLDNTLRTYRSESYTRDNLTLNMLNTSRRILQNRGMKILNILSKKKIKDLGIKFEKSEVEAGSGSLPENKIKSMALSFKPHFISVNRLSRQLRCGPIPIVGYISGNIYYIDLKAILPSQLKKLAKAINDI